jgi:protein-tyrosine phosphatase
MNDEKLICVSCGAKTETTMNGFYFCHTCKDFQSTQLVKMSDSRPTIYPEIDQITDKVFLGNEDAGREKENLLKIGITHILLCGSYLQERFKESFEYLKIDIDDSLEQNIKKHFKETFDFIEKAEKVFVHCAAGVSRSASIVIYYLMKKNQMKYDEAYEFVKSKRSIIRPNSNFINQLKSVEQYEIK